MAGAEVVLSVLQLAKQHAACRVAVTFDFKYPVLLLQIALPVFVWPAVSATLRSSVFVARTQRTSEGTRLCSACMSCGMMFLYFGACTAGRQAEPAATLLEKGPVWPAECLPFARQDSARFLPACCPHAGKQRGRMANPTVWPRTLGRQTPWFAHTPNFQP